MWASAPQRCLISYIVVFTCWSMVRSVAENMVEAHFFWLHNVATLVLLNCSCEQNDFLSVCILVKIRFDHFEYSHFFRITWWADSKFLGHTHVLLMTWCGMWKLKGLRSDLICVTKLRNSHSLIPNFPNAFDLQPLQSEFKSIFGKFQRGI